MIPEEPQANVGVPTPPPDRAAALELQIRRVIRSIFRAELCRPGQTVEGALDRALDEYREILDAARGGR